MARADGNAHIRLTAAGAQAIQEWQRFTKHGPEQTDYAFRKMGASGRRAGSAAGGAFRGAAKDSSLVSSGLARIGVLITSTISFVSLLRNEVESVLELQGREGQSQVTFANAFRRAVFALGTGSDLTPDKLREMILANRSGVDFSSLSLEAEAALSARGGLSASAAADTVGAAADLRPDLETTPRIALESAALALQKAFDDVSPEQAVSGVIQALSAARTEDIETFSKNMVGAIAQSRSLGGDQDSFRFLASIFTAVGQRAEDPSGRRTATNTLIFLQQILEAVKGRGIVAADASIEETLNALIAGESGSEAEKLRQTLVGVFDQSLGEIPRELENIAQGVADAKIRGEARTVVPLIEILDPRRQSRTWEEIRGAQQKIVGLNDESVKIVSDQLSAIRGLPEQTAAEVQRALKTVVERQRIEGNEGVAGVSRELLTEALKRTGAFDTEARLRTFVNALLSQGTTPTEQIDSIREIIERQTSRVREEGQTNIAIDAISVLTSLIGGAIGIGVGGIVGLGLPGAIAGGAIGARIGEKPGSAIEQALGNAGFGGVAGEQQKDIRDLQNLDADLAAIQDRLQPAVTEAVKEGVAQGLQSALAGVNKALTIKLIDQDGQTRPTEAGLPT